MSDTLLPIAQDLYRQFGARLTLAQIAERAGVSRATVYQRLGNKAQVLQRLAGDCGAGATPMDRESRIMQAVLDAAMQSGVRAATLENIAQRAGVGVATIYRHYGDKEGLIRRFITLNHPGTVLTMPPGDGPVRQQLEALITALLTYMAQNAGIVRLVLAGSAEDREYLRALRDGNLSTSKRIEAFFAKQQAAGTMRTDIAPPELAANLAGMLYAHILFAPAPRDFDIPRITHAILTMFDAVLINEAS